MKNKLKKSAFMNQLFTPFSGRLRAIVKRISITAFAIYCINIIGTSGVCQNTPMVSSGKSHSAFLNNDGTVWSWGSNWDGALGDQHAVPPVKAKDLHSIVTLSCGYYHTVAVKSNGDVWAWGKNNYGQLGNDEAKLDEEGVYHPGTDQYIPIKVGITDVIAVAGGRFHTVALKSDGTVWTWGENRSGQLGDGSFGDPASGASKGVPVQVVGLDSVIAIAAGDSHTVALKSDGSVWTWGDNLYTQLGTGSFRFREPYATQVPDVSEVVGIAAGAKHTLVLKTDGTVWAWGDGAEGQLGDDGATYDPALTHPYSRWTPIQVVGLSGVVSISSVSDHSVAIKDDGTAWSWGDNLGGQLGDGTNENQKKPVQMILSDGISAEIYVNQVISVACGKERTIVLRNDGGIFACGENSFRTLGDGTDINRNTLVTVLGLPSFLPPLLQGTVTAGYAHSAAISLVDNIGYSWGRNRNGQLGMGWNSDRTYPITIATDNLIEVSAGAYHTVGLKADKTVWTWGLNKYGQLGNGTTTSKTKPKLVESLSDVDFAIAGQNHTIAVTSDGTLYSWGLNNKGQLGDGSTTHHLLPVPISGFSAPIYDAVAGAEHTVALQSDGTVWAWGLNSYGQLGNGITENSSTPVQVLGLENIVRLAAGRHFTMALKSNGSVWVWGKNNNGQLGIGTTDFVTTPVQVSALSDVNIIAIEAGDNHALALAADRTLWGWGLNVNGQVGDGTAVYKRVLPVMVDSGNVILAIAGGGSHSILLKADGSVWTWGLNKRGQLGHGNHIKQFLPTEVPSLDLMP